MAWSVLEGATPAWCDKIKLGLPGRDEQIENWCRTLEDMWSNVTCFQEALIPVAEKAGVHVSLRPDDPPISPIGGIARVWFSTPMAATRLPGPARWAK